MLMLQNAWQTTWKLIFVMKVVSLEPEEQSTPEQQE
jgi:hypothetical protein